MPLATGNILNNRYRIVSLLGQGGMGAVYRAWDINLTMPVALKENLSAAREAQDQFIHEAKILSRLSHPGLPRVTDYFAIPGQGQYLVMDFVTGEDLGDMLKKYNRLNEAQVMGWAGQVCEALSYLHTQPLPIVHRDIKPSNIKINQAGRALLVDFGIAKVYQNDLATVAGAKAITPGYSPPEQYGYGKTDPRTDIYALGATLYHLLTGTLPPESVQRLAGTAPLLPPRQLNPNISFTAENAILKAMQISAGDRFQTISEFQAALRGQPAGAVHAPQAATVIAPAYEATARAMQANDLSSPSQPVSAPVYPAQPLPIAATGRGRRPWGILALVLIILLIAGGWLAHQAGYITLPFLPEPDKGAEDEQVQTIPTDTTSPEVSPTSTEPVVVILPSPTIWIVTATSGPATPTNIPLPSPTSPPPPTNTPYISPTPEQALFTAYETMFCRNGPDTGYETHFTVNGGDTWPALARWSNDWILLGINHPSTRTRCCWVGGAGSLNVSQSSLPLINYLPDRINCPLNP